MLKGTEIIFSYVYRNIQINNYNYYRILIYNYIKSNKQILKDFFYYLDDESEKEYNERYESYIENIQNDKNYASDFEISAEAIVLKKL